MPAIVTARMGDTHAVPLPTVMAHGPNHRDNPPLTVPFRVSLEHHTEYHYDRPATLGPHTVRLRPAPHCRTPILSYSLRLTPPGHFINWQQDPVGNHLARLVFPEPTDELSVTVDLVADLTVINPFDFFVEEAARAWPFRYDDLLVPELAPYLDTGGDDTPLLSGWLEQVSRTDTPIIDLLVALNQRVQRDVAYETRMETGVHTPEQTLERASGSCRDSAWLLVHVLRRLGIAARFASGYLVQLDPDTPAKDFTDLHAWAEAYVPGAGWIGLDATSGLLAGEGHIPLACASRPELAAPIEGTSEAPAVRFGHANHVTRLTDDEGPATAPYADEEWARIDALGERVDDLLGEGDVRLTMGGEPTFVAREKADTPEWNIAADGPTKQARARRLADGLAARLAPGALIRHGQGKWYPGEPLPRWQIGVHWRTDGEPLWRDRRWLADPAAAAARTADDARAVAERILEALRLPHDVLVAAYEDPLHRLAEEAALPAGAPPSADVTTFDDVAVQDARARAAVIEALDRDRGEPVGFAIPLHRGLDDDGWRTGYWRLRRGHLFLVPGDSPMGMRLPLSSIAWAPAPPDPERSLFAEVAPLNGHGNGADGDDEHDVADPPPITALCVQARAGHVHVFIPPLEGGDDAVELIAAVEQAAAAAETEVVIEGYAPPPDTRLAGFDVTPDPGVIEVNIHPSASWRELQRRTTDLYDAADRAGLEARKFALDGSEQPTGGGSHLTLGGPRPPDSPLLRRPDLLRSMLTFWQHHPSLSYLFSGRFVGPTSQAPRLDEGRHESLYELEIAFAELDRLAGEHPGRRPPPWQVDRQLRTDLTGNTHRAEFCIDKLFDPLTERGRLGVLELRGFEMPPHPRMALVEALLVRALVARFWATPYRAELVRWGTELHDRFLLPFWIAQDAAEVADDLAAHGIPFEARWLEPFHQFRFPCLGEAFVDGLRIELRAAIEPWHVLGEEQGAGTARYVDSSVQRLQVRVDAFAPERRLVRCNGVPVPLYPTGEAGTYVAGVRYRAWQPPSALHPTIAVHAPLVFDVVDRPCGRSLGGCTYHVTHPGGRAYERPPANGHEAEARRASRFVAAGHGPDLEPADALADPPRDREYPRTLDLRRVRR